MSSRDAILQDVRRHLPESAPLPDLDGPWIRFDDPAAQFASVLEMIGGTCLRVPNRAAIPAALEQVPAYRAATRRVCGLPGLAIEAETLEAVSDPHELDTVDFAILPGVFAVAENAAVWVTAEGIPHRVIYFLCEHLALVVPAQAIVNNLAEAYERIRCDHPQFSGFIAGPSKTADIEQSLVIGAHGPRSLTVLLVEDEPAG